MSSRNLARVPSDPSPSDSPLPRPSLASVPERLRLFLAATGPLALLALIVWLFTAYGSLLVGQAPVPVDALGKLDIERVVFRPDQIEVQVLNSGPSDLIVAQVLINEAIWSFSSSPDGAVPRLGRMTLAIPYPWVYAEPHTIKLVTSTGLAFSKTVAFATLTPEPGLSSFALFALLGIYVGVVPVYLGMLWLPVLWRLGRKAMEFTLALTVGLLLFLGLDAIKEAFELAARVPGPYQGIGLVALGGLGAFLTLVATGRQLRGLPGARTEAGGRLALAYLIAVGIGLHNLGEGLAIGAAYALGELALGAFLVIGFTIHNTTEGFGIVAPAARDGIRLRHLTAFGLLAGAPTILGTWLGGFSLSDVWATLFLAIGAGAIFQVVFELARRPGRTGRSWLADPANAVGILVGMGLMYGTGLLVAG